MSEAESRKRKQKNLGRYLCLLLRHHPEKANLHMDNHGWVTVDELITGVRVTKDENFNWETLDEIVATDNKQRYSYSADGSKIRANQGHSLPVDLDLSESAPPEILWHGTAEKSEEKILEEGLLPQTRQYVHLSADYETAVKVGQRHGKPVVFRVDAGRAHDSGIQFRISANGVWLVDRIPAEYLSLADTDERKAGEETEEK